MQVISFRRVAFRHTKPTELHTEMLESVTLAVSFEPFESPVTRSLSHRGALATIKTGCYF